MVQAARTAQRAKSDSWGEALGLAHEVVRAKKGVNPPRSKGPLGTLCNAMWAGAGCQAGSNLKPTAVTRLCVNVSGAESMLAINLNSTERRKAHGVSSGLEPDSGNPTVRDHREALGNTAMEELGTRSTIERVDPETLFLRC
jgi:hypothetical protein